MEPSETEPCYSTGGTGNVINLPRCLMVQYLSKNRLSRSGAIAPSRGRFLGTRTHSSSCYRVSLLRVAAGHVDQETEVQAGFVELRNLHGERLRHRDGLACRRQQRGETTQTEGERESGRATGELQRRQRGSAVHIFSAVTSRVVHMVTMKRMDKIACLRARCWFVSIPATEFPWGSQLLNYPRWYDAVQKRSSH